MADQRPIGFWLVLVERMITERFASTLDEHGVTRRQWQLLNALESGPATVERLDAAVAPLPATGDGESSAEHLAELVESGWVARSSAGFTITDRGRIAFDRLAEVVQANRELATEGIGADEYDAMVATLERMARNLGWSDES